MKALKILLLLLVAVADAKPPQKESIELKALCFNIRNGYGKDGENRWENRKDFVAEVIADDAADVVGLQEVFDFQLAHLLKKLPGYRAVGQGRDGGNKGEHCSILYRADRFELIDSGTFWLSDTPDVPSKHWGNGPRRICTWVKLKDRKSERAFHVYNTHLDHRSEPSRQKSAELIMKTIAKNAAEAPFVLCGDFNSGAGSPVVSYLKGKAPLAEPNPIPLLDTWRVCHPFDPDSGTVSLFNGCRVPCKIDAIYVAPGHQVLGAEILRVHRDGRYPSDHYPLNARLRLK